MVDLYKPFGYILKRKQYLVFGKMLSIQVVGLPEIEKRLDALRDVVKAEVVFILRMASRAP